MTIDLILDCRKAGLSIPASVSGVHRQILSYISSYSIINRLNIDVFDCYDRLYSIRSSGDHLASQFFSLHESLSVNHFDYSGSLDAYNRRSGSDFRLSLGLNSNEPHLDKVFLLILRNHFEIFHEPVSFVVMTHDIDKTSYVETMPLLCKALIGDLLKRKKLYLGRLVHFFSKRSIHKHLSSLFSDTFPRITFILPKKDSIHADYDAVSFLHFLLSLGYESSYGLHYSIQSSEETSSLDSEFSTLSQHVPIPFCRAHYLNRSPYIDSWLSNSQLIDLTPYALDSGGFYIPSSYPFFIANPNLNGGVFSLNTTFMDVTFHFMRNSFSRKSELLSSYCCNVSQYGGIFVANWHNTSFFWGNWPFDPFNYDYLISFLKCYFDD